MFTGNSGQFFICLACSFGGSAQSIGVSERDSSEEICTLYTLEYIKFMQTLFAPKLALLSIPIDTQIDNT